MNITEVINDFDTATTTAKKLYGEEFKVKFFAREAANFGEMERVMRVQPEDLVDFDPVLKYEQLIDMSKRLYNDTARANVDLEREKENAIAKRLEAKESLAKDAKIFQKAIGRRTLTKRGAHKAAVKIMEKKGLVGMDFGEDKELRDNFIRAFNKCQNILEEVENVESIIPELERTASLYDDVRKRFNAENKGKLKRAAYISRHYRINMQDRMNVINKRMSRRENIVSQKLDLAANKVKRLLGETRARFDKSQVIKEEGLPRFMG